MRLREAITPIAVGFGDGLTDLAAEYIDEVTGKTGEEFIKRPSTWVHIGIGAVGATLGVAWLRGNAALAATIVGLRGYRACINDANVRRLAKGYYFKSFLTELLCHDRGLGLI